MTQLRDWRTSRGEESKPGPPLTRAGLCALRPGSCSQAEAASQ